MLKLNGFGIRPWMEFELDPSSGRYTKRRFWSHPPWRPGYSGWGQELKVRGLGTVLCALYLHQGEIILRLGNRTWNLFEPGLAITHEDHVLHCEFTVRERGREPVTFRYRRKDILLLIIDSTYDNLDMELANMPGSLPGWCESSKADMVALLDRNRTTPPESARENPPA
jgi:hypothetical protein